MLGPQKHQHNVSPNVLRGPCEGGVSNQNLAEQNELGQFCLAAFGFSAFCLVNKCYPEITSIEMRKVNSFSTSK